MIRWSSLNRLLVFFLFAQIACGQVTKVVDDSYEQALIKLNDSYIEQLVQLRSGFKVRGETDNALKVEQRIKDVSGKIFDAALSGKSYPIIDNVRIIFAPGNRVNGVKYEINGTRGIVFLHGGVEMKAEFSKDWNTVTYTGKERTWSTRLQDARAPEIAARAASTPAKYWIKTDAKTLVSAIRFNTDSTFTETWFHTKEKRKKRTAERPYKLEGDVLSYMGNKGEVTFKVGSNTLERNDQCIWRPCTEEEYNNFMKYTSFEEVVGKAGGSGEAFGKPADAR